MENAILEFSINRVIGGQSTTVALIRMNEDGSGEPEFLNPPDALSVALVRRALDTLDRRAAAIQG